MNTRAIRLVPSLLCCLLLSATAARALWIEDGVPVAETEGGQDHSLIMTDGAGGALVVWQDFRSMTTLRDIYMQRFDGSGTPQWSAGGVALCAETADQTSPRFATDGGGGAIVVWHDARAGDTDIYAQRIKASGTVQWAAGGVGICTETGSQSGARIVEDGAGGAFIVWNDRRNATDYDIYIQRVSAIGKRLWAANGVAVCTEAGDQMYPRIVTDGADGVIVCWQDGRSGLNAVYAQRIDERGVVQWTAGGVAVCTAAGAGEMPRMVSDDAGGAIVVWEDYRNGGTSDLYAQRLSAAGSRLWTNDGTAICTRAYDQLDAEIVMDGAGGAMIVWEDWRMSGVFPGIYAQRIDGAGTSLWEANGQDVYVGAASQKAPDIARSGYGALVTWEDERSGQMDIYAQLLDASGTAQWDADGVLVGGAPGSDGETHVVSDGAGGGIFAWSDERTESGGVAVQHVDSLVRIGYVAHAVASVADLPGDEGGAVRIGVDRTSYDDPGWYSWPVSLYNVWRRVDAPPVSSGDPSGTDVRPDIRIGDAEIAASGVDLREFLAAAEFPPGSWEIVGSFGACQLEEYLSVAGTTTDSTSAGIPWNVFLVSAHTTIPSMWFLSEPDSGYSVDNLAPAAPVGLAGAPAPGPPGVTLNWDANTEDDLSFYAVHRGSDAGFVPSRFTEIGQTAEPEITDEYESWYESYYKVCAVDRHGNAGPYAVIGPDQLTGSDPPALPGAGYLDQNYPNPFNPCTAIRFGLSRDSRVSLRIFDISGRLVRVVVDEFRPAGVYTVRWDGRTSRGTCAASGIYHYRLVSGELDETRKMVLLR